MKRGLLRTLLLAAAVTSVLATAPSQAAGFPEQPIHIVVPFSPGGGVDMVGRILAEQMSKQIGQPVVVDNKPGASANIGADFVARAAPNGYTVLLSANGLAANATLFPAAPFNPLKDFAPITKVGSAPLVIIVSKNSPYANLGSLLAAARKQPGQLSYASAGNGSSQHLAGELLKQHAHIDAMHVPYKGGAPAMTDLLGGRVNFMVQNPLEALSLLHSHDLRALAVSSDKRMAVLPDVPTAAEAGLPGYEASVWWGVVAPARTPRPIVDKLNAEFVAAMNDPATHAKLTKLGVQVEPQTPEQYGHFLAAEVAKWANVIKVAHIQVN